MKRSDLERKLTELKTQFRMQLEAAPVTGFFAGVLLGVVLVVLRDLIVPLAALAALVGAALWFFAETEPRTPFSTPPEPNEIPTPPLPGEQVMMESDPLSGEERKH